MHKNTDFVLYFFFGPTFETEQHNSRRSPIMKKQILEIKFTHMDSFNVRKEDLRSVFQTYKQQ